MASEDLFSEGVQYSEEILYNKESPEEDGVEEVETEPEIIPQQNTSISTEIENIPSEVNDELQPAVETEVVSKDKPPEKTNDQRPTSLPITRIRNLMRLDPDLHIASLEAVFAVTKATEMFIESLSKEAFVHTSQAKKKTVQKRDVDMAIASVDSLMFLEGAMNF